MKVGLLIRWFVEIDFQCSTDWSRHLVNVICMSIKFGKEVSSSAHQESAARKGTSKEGSSLDRARQVRERG
jgi:hypothetical protein